MGKKLPTPFQRPSIDLGAPKKVWKVIPAAEVRMGDIVQGHNRGWVTEVHDEVATVCLVFKNGSVERVFSDTPLTVFTEDTNGIIQ